MEHKHPQAVIRRYHTFADGSRLQHEGEFIMDELTKYVGDGNLKITFGSSESDKNFGNGTDTHVSITASCNQDLRSAGAVLEILKKFVLGYIPNAHSEALAIWQSNRELNSSFVKG
jgi:hypothetical protein